MNVLSTRLFDFKDCYIDVWSRDLKGQVCELDRDCDGGYPCINSRCAVPYDLQQKQFMSCFTSRISLQEKFYFSDLIGFDSNNDRGDAFSRAMLSYFSMDSDCVASTGFAPYRTIYDVAYLPLPGVPPPAATCERKCLSRYACQPCLLAVQVYTPGEELKCTSAVTCNWSPSSPACSSSSPSFSLDACESACGIDKDYHFCGLCDESGTKCSPVKITNSNINTTAKAQCEATQACLLPNGTVITVESEAKCLQYGVCNIASKTTREECENAVQCNDDILINTSVSPPIVSHLTLVSNW